MHAKNAAGIPFHNDPDYPCHRRRRHGPGSNPAIPAVGTWKLNLDKSKYKEGRRPKRATHTIESAAEGIKTIVDGVSGDGTVPTLRVHREV